MAETRDSHNQSLEERIDRLSDHLKLPDKDKNEVRRQILEVLAPYQGQTESVHIQANEDLLKTCDDCGQPAVFVRYTQFSGDHYFCEKHAKEESNFGQEDPSYFTWAPYP
jgi:hypothetical protein